MELANFVLITLGISAILLLLNGMIVTLRLYLISSFSEFLFLFLIFFLSFVAITVVFSPLPETFRIKVFYSLSSVTYLPFLYFGNKIRKYPSILLRTFNAYALILVLSTYFWEPLDGTAHPIFPYPSFNETVFNMHYGLVIGKVIIISTRFNAPLTVFRLAISLILLYTMWSIQEDKGIPGLKKAKRLWIVALILTVIHDFLFIFVPSIWSILLLNVALVFANYIMVFTPEGIVLTRVQVFELYDKITTITNQVNKPKEGSSLTDLHKHILEVKKIMEKDS